MKIILQHPELFLHCPRYRLGNHLSTLADLQDAALLSNPPEVLEQLGYRQIHRMTGTTPLMDLTAPLLQELLKQTTAPVGLVVHHCFGTNATEPWQEANPSLMERASYLPAALLRRVGVDHLPYFGSFATGCTGLLSLILTARGLLAGQSSLGDVICLTTDVVPPGAHYDAAKERFLVSDVCSGFLVSQQRRGLRVAGISTYSSSRTSIPSVEIVKRTVEMATELLQSCGIDLTNGKVWFHYPNLFLPAWEMVRRYLRYPAANHVVEGIGERGHCLTSDGVITLANRTLGPGSAWHCVVGFGSGLHLGLCLFENVSGSDTV